MMKSNEQVICLLLLLIFAFLFMGSLWQLEIADLCLINGWTFKFFFNLIIVQDAWQARDAFFLLLIVSFIGETLVSRYLWRFS